MDSELIKQGRDPRKVQCCGRTTGEPRCENYGIPEAGDDWFCCGEHLAELDFWLQFYGERGGHRAD